MNVIAFLTYIHSRSILISLSSSNRRHYRVVGGRIIVRGVVDLRIEFSIPVAVTNVLGRKLIWVCCWVEGSV